MATRPISTSTSSAKTPPRPQAPYHLYTSQNLPRGHPIPNPNSSTSSSLASHLHQPPTAAGLLYPVASSGRGFITRPTRPPDQTRTGAYPPRAVTPLFMGRLHPRAPTRLHYPQLHQQQQQQQQLHHVQPPHHPHQPHPHAAALVASSAPINGVPVSGQLKVGPSPSAVSDSNGYTNLRDNKKEDTLVTIRDRKVRITDGASLYELCRSWLRNGFPEENQSLYGDGVKALPRPLPIPVADSSSPKRDEEFVEDNDDEESVAHLSTEDLLKRHIKRAKKVRSWLRERRLKRIARYKTRLALLLPPQFS